MKILHVSMGLPPFRTGGLNRYCSDIMKQQVKDGHKVALLYPGEFTFDGKVRIHKEKNAQFYLFRILNPLPLALSNGIQDPVRYIKEVHDDIYQKFLYDLSPDVIHVHSLQGIHKEFFFAATAQKIRMVFTTHDYYPFCPCCVLMDAEGNLCTGPKPEKCALCNAERGFSKKQEFIMQSRLYAKLKYTPLMEAIRNRQKTNKCHDSSLKKTFPVKSEGYKDLLDYYALIMGTMDLIHCNSEIAQREYQKHFPSLSYKVLPITHAGLRETTHLQFDKEVFRIGFLGGLAPYKGIQILLQATALLDEMGEYRWELWLYGGDFSAYITDSRIHNGGYFSTKEEDEIWQSFDLLVVPSLWKETFGFVVEEAIFHHVLVVCSDLVGSQMLLPKSAIYPHNSPEKLAEAMKRCYKNPKNISTESMLSIEQHCKILEDYLYKQIR